MRRIFPQYVEDVTAWDYQYQMKKDAGPVEHDTKVRPKSEPAGSQRSSSEDRPKRGCGGRGWGR